MAGRGWGDKACEGTWGIPVCTWNMGEAACDASPRPRARMLRLTHAEALSLLAVYHLLVPCAPMETQNRLLAYFRKEQAPVRTKLESSLNSGTIALRRWASNLTSAA
jgi:hypothetical protein